MYLQKKLQSESKFEMFGYLYSTNKFRFFLYLDRYSKSVGASHYQTSAKANRGIEELFLDVTQQLLRMAESQNELNSSPGLTHNRNPEVVIVDDNPAPKKSCCG